MVGILDQGWLWDLRYVPGCLQAAIPFPYNEDYSYFAAVLQGLNTRKIVNKSRLPVLLVYFCLLPMMGRINYSLPLY